MSLHIYNDLEQGGEQWLAARRGIVTASTIGALLTVEAPGAAAYECSECNALPDEPCKSLRGGAPIKTHHPARADLARRLADTATPVLKVADNDTSRGLTMLLAAERITGHTEDVYVSSDMWRGTIEEPIAREFYAAHHAPVTECGFMVREQNGVRIGYSPDGLVGDDGLVEFKSRKPKKHIKTVLDGKPPAENMAQLQCGLYVSGRDWIDYGSFSGGLHFWTVRVYPDQRWFDAIQCAAEDFEANADDIILRYSAVVDGLPLTERTPELEEIRL